MPPTRLRVRGMSCEGCVRAVTRVVMDVDGVDRVTVDLPGGWAEYEGDAEPEAVADAIEDAGFEALVPDQEPDPERGS